MEMDKLHDTLKSLIDKFMGKLSNNESHIQEFENKTGKNFNNFKDEVNKCDKKNLPNKLYKINYFTLGDTHPTTQIENRNIYPEVVDIRDTLNKIYSDRNRKD